MSNYLGPVSNGTHHRWARPFIRSLKLTLRSIRHTSFDGFKSTTFILVPPKRYRSRRYAQINMGKFEGPQKALYRTKRSFKFGLEIPRNWSDILRIDEAAGSTLWKGGAEKDVDVLIRHKYFAFKSTNFKPSNKYQYCRLHIIYNVKSDLTPKARLACDGSRIKPEGCQPGPQ